MAWSNRSSVVTIGGSRRTVAWRAQTRRDQRSWLRQLDMIIESACR
jgi:hypothetical protein